MEHLTCILISVSISYLITHLLLQKHLLDIEKKFHETCEFTIKEVSKLKNKSMH